MRTAAFTPIVLVTIAVLCFGVVIFFGYRSFLSEDDNLRRAVAKTAASDCTNTAVNRAVQKVNLNLDRQIYLYVAGQTPTTGVKRVLIAGAKAKKELKDLIPASECKNQLQILIDEGIELTEEQKRLLKTLDPQTKIEGLIKKPVLDPSDPTINPENPRQPVRQPRIRVIEPPGSAVPGPGGALTPTPSPSVPPGNSVLPNPSSPVTPSVPPPPTVTPPTTTDPVPGGVIDLPDLPLPNVPPQLPPPEVPSLPLPQLPPTPTVTLPELPRILNP